MFIPIVFLMVIALLRGKRLGQALPNNVTSIVLNPNKTYNVETGLLAGGGVLHNRGYGKVYYSHANTIYKSVTGGPNLALVLPTSEFSINGDFVRYVTKLKDGSLAKDPETNKPLIFNSLEDANLYAYEKFYLPTIKGNPDWISEQHKLVQRAKGITITEEQKDTETNVSETGQMQQLDRRQVRKLKPMGPAEKVQFMTQVKNSIASLPQSVFELEIDGETMDLNGIDRFTGTPAPAVQLHNMYEKGLQDGRREGTGQAVKILLYAFAFAGLFLGVALAVYVIAHVK